MGSPLKKLTRFANKTMPHTWVMGESASAQYDLAGQLTGAHDRLYKPKDVTPPPRADVDQSGLIERDRQRRLARRAAGRDSTVRTGPGGAPYDGAPKTLLGS